MDFLTLARTSDAVAAVSAKRSKASLLADLLRRLEMEEVEATIGFLLATPRQSRTGVGWAQVIGRSEQRALVDEQSDRPRLSVLDVDAVLDRLAGLSGPGSQALRAAELDSLFALASDAERRLVRGIFLGEIRQGALAGVLTEATIAAFGVNAQLFRRAVMLAGSLAVAAVIAARSGDEGLRNVGLVPGRGIQPMLASTAGSVAEAVTKLGRVSVEWKLDGARVQVHRDGDEVRVFTRNLNDITARLPQVVELVRSFAARSFVLDGEILGLDPDGRPQTFQDTMSRFGSEEAGAASQLRPYFFDILHLDGEDLLDDPLDRRQDVLERLTSGWRLPTLITDDPHAGEAFSAEALAAGHEGVMVKAIDSPYEAGRRGSRWLKVKPVRTLDLVVLAAEWGSGRRSGWLSNLHLGARGPNGDFVMVGKTFKGMTDELLRWQTAELERRAVAMHDGVVDEGRWVVPVRPELVVEIAVDGVQISRRYPGGVALRFARVRGYRPDRDAATADTIETVRSLLASGAHRPQAAE